MNDYITMLGTGNALANRCYNTCFTLHSEKGILLVDAGGGNGILTQLEKAGIMREVISDLFVTHAHTDHLLGCIWVIRMALEDGKSLRVWSHAKVLNLLTSICQQILPKNQAENMEELVTMHLLEDGDKFEAGGFPLQCFDIHSTKERQFGFEAQLSDGRRLCCLGDEPFSTQCRQYAEGTDWLMSEAFCLYEDRNRFLPYEKHHSTVLDAARLAEELRVKNLILYHTEDRTLDTRCERYTMEADVLVCGSPNYCGYPSAALRAFMERMEFPAVNYSDYSKPVVLKRICSATIYTMNCPNEEVYRQMNYHVLMDTAANQLGVFGPTEILCSYDTYQFSNYDRYDAATFSEAHKAEVRDNQFPIDLEKAYELGKRLVGKCDKNREV